MSTPLIDMQGVATFRGVHYDTVRKGWKSWVRDLGFPAPVVHRPYRWNLASLDAWLIRREAENRAELLKAVAGDTTVSDAPANENTLDAAPVGRVARRIDRERSTVLSFMAGAAR